MEVTGVCSVCGKVTGSQNGQHFTDNGTRCDGCNVIRMRCWTGPVDVKHDACLLRDAGLNVVCEGTEHVYLDVAATNTDTAREKIIQAMIAKHGSVKGMRFNPVR